MLSLRLKPDPVDQWSSPRAPYWSPWGAFRLPQAQAIPTLDQSLNCWSWAGSTSTFQSPQGDSQVPSRLRIGALYACGHLSFPFLPSNDMHECLVNARQGTRYPASEHPCLQSNGSQGGMCMCVSQTITQRDGGGGTLTGLSSQEWPEWR